MNIATQSTKSLDDLQSQFNLLKLSRSSFGPEPSQWPKTLAMGRYFLDNNKRNLLGDALKDTFTEYVPTLDSSTMFVSRNLNSNQEWFGNRVNEMSDDTFQAFCNTLNSNVLEKMHQLFEDKWAKEPENTSARPFKTQKSGTMQKKKRSPGDVKAAVVSWPDEADTDMQEVGSRSIGQGTDCDTLPLRTFGMPVVEPGGERSPVTHVRQMSIASILDDTARVHGDSRTVKLHHGPSIGTETGTGSKSLSE
ncbi:hypothetical protein BD324DRAFT_654132 [Kockovaella imperatae]|uniref:Uncharacterized protein n=1 Tax=Kockovaella imperatae TaxID=4999 RepID=A0A1Y1U5W3_9TREE|nr:hypothetical protein BD324DRAFT_654132 [Kockovaella imperatae]ORX33418.1 hypothetical protein BD324DRAFT_654132 [Kockovaella imperatae]